MTEHIPSERQHIASKLQQVLSLHNIYKQSLVLTHLNPKMQISLSHLLQIDLLRSINFEQAISIIKLVPFLHLQQRVNVDKTEQIVRICYTNTSTLVVVTGIYFQALRTILHDYIYSNNRRFNFAVSTDKNCQIKFHNDFLIIIQGHSQQNSHNLLKYLRLQKKNQEGRKGNNLIIPNSRGRIVNIQNVFTLLMDLMSDHKCDYFMKCMERDNLERNSHKRAIKPAKCLNYRLFTSNSVMNWNIMGQYYNQQISPSQVQEHSKPKEQSACTSLVGEGQIKNIVSPGKMTNCEDQQSQSTSFNSEVRENRLQQEQTDKQIDDLCPFQMYKSLKDYQEICQSLS